MTPRIDYHVFILGFAAGVIAVGAAQRALSR
jgi:hypothetical protein